MPPVPRWWMVQASTLAIFRRLPVAAQAPGVGAATEASGRNGVTWGSYGLLHGVLVGSFNPSEKY